MRVLFSDFTGLGKVLIIQCFTLICVRVKPNNIIYPYANLTSIYIVINWDDLCQSSFYIHKVIGLVFFPPPSFWGWGVELDTQLNCVFR